MGVKLTDIVAIETPVTIGEHTFQVRGLPATHLAQLLFRFPEFQDLVASDKDITATQILSLATACVGAVLAAAVGMAGEADQEAAAAKLPAGTQLEILEAAIRLSAPNGIGPFVETLISLVSEVGGNLPKFGTAA